MKYCQQGRSDGGYIGIYTSKISNRSVRVSDWDINTSFEIAMTVVETYTPPIKFLATPLTARLLVITLAIDVSLRFDVNHDSWARCAVLCCELPLDDDKYVHINR